MTNLPRRVTGVVLLGISVLLYDAASNSPLHMLALPLAMAIAAWLMVQNAAAVLLGTTLLSAIHADPVAPDWIVGRAYPLVAVLSGAALGYIALHRFRGRIESTREARWQKRRERAGDSTTRKGDGDE